MSKFSRLWCHGKACSSNFWAKPSRIHWFKQSWQGGIGMISKFSLCGVKRSPTFGDLTWSGEPTWQMPMVWSIGIADVTNRNDSVCAREGRKLLVLRCFESTAIKRNLCWCKLWFNHGEKQWCQILLRVLAVNEVRANTCCEYMQRINFSISKKCVCVSRFWVELKLPWKETCF